MAYPVVTFPDAAALVASHLRIELPPAGFPGKVLSQVPDPRPGSFTAVRRFGGTTINPVTDRAVLVIECWAADEGDAMDRAQKARALINALPGTLIDGVPIYRVNELGGPALDPDPLSAHPRVTFRSEVWMRGT